MPRFVGLRLGSVAVDGGDAIEVETTVEAMPSALWDAVVLPGGLADGGLAVSSEVLDFVKDQYRHAKPMFVLGAVGRGLLGAAGITSVLDGDEPDPGLVVVQDDHAAIDALLDTFVTALSRHRHLERELKATGL